MNAARSAATDAEHQLVSHDTTDDGSGWGTATHGSALAARWERIDGGHRAAADREPDTVAVKVRPVRAAVSGERYALVALDALAVGAACTALGSGWRATAVRVLAVLVALAVAGQYRPRLQFSLLDDVGRLTVAVAVVLPLGIWLGLPARVPAPAAAQPAVFAATVLAAVLAGRAAGYRAVAWRRRHSPGDATLLVGAGDVAVRLAEALRADRTYGLAPVGFVGPVPLTEPTLPVPVLGSVAELEQSVIRFRPRHLIVTYSGTPDADLVGALRRCRRRGVNIFVVPRLFDLGTTRSGAETVRGIPVQRLRPEPAQQRRWAVKRLMDVCGAAFALIVLSPLLAVCAVAVRAECGRRAVLFRQVRIGRDGRPFTILKFRSLTPSSEHESAVRWNIASDTRVGPVGRLLRASSLDELPQFINVLRGDMSLVGPRPERPFFVDQFQRAYAGYPDRHRVPAGITGWAQIHGLRGDTSIEDRVRYDNYYIENWSLGLDIKIILRTVRSMVSIHRL